MAPERLAFMLMGFFYTVSASMNLAKLVRDREEAAKLDKLLKSTIEAVA